MNILQRIRRRVAQSDPGVKALSRAFGDMVDLVENVGDFRNGNTHQGIDEGNVRGWEAFRRIQDEAQDTGLWVSREVFYRGQVPSVTGRN